MDLVFTSHTMVYERSHPLRGGKIDHDEGTVYIVAGGAGQRPEWNHHAKGWHSAASRAVPHCVEVAVAGNRLELRAFDFTGRLFDSTVLTKAL